ncbi:saccharopine dehydrogenase family protein [Photobacterium sp.]|uniref:saccharopine dehydrogenase family protein n=1 Tax=Photobacterium sp. TaxID=660 RepID=UPI00299DAA64|nr:saccharopine dehydrogenase NADP-binding domain-containing protein [Photobacterium sp.]MDX1300958.1 saccharopine dehydrogenase NADP-binding domain-containing protein [Photobacterium sp.]
MFTRAFDIVLFGATSFVGQITAHHMSDRFGKNSQVNWAIAGRDLKKLGKLRRQLGGSAENIPIILADSADEQSIKNLCQQTRVVATTVGPFDLYGELLVKACAETGTDYCDLTGEVQFIKRMIDSYGEQAKASGARIVHCCGFDSIPSDLGVFFLQDQALQRWSEPCSHIDMRVTKMKGMLSGGTIASMINVAKVLKQQPDLRKPFKNPYLLVDELKRPKERQKDLRSVEFDSQADAWSAPFIMAGINTRVVFRTNSLLNDAYGQPFYYNEAIVTGKGKKGRRRAKMMVLGLAGLWLGILLAPSRWLLQKFVLPKPGQGPSAQEQLDGSYQLQFFGRTDSGRQLTVEITGDRDPGYGSTSKILTQAAECLAFDLEKEQYPGGFWTPASLMGKKLIKRLTSHAGLTFKVLD